MNSNSLLHSKWTLAAHNFRAIQDSNYNPHRKKMVRSSSQDHLKQETAFIFKNANFFVTVMLLILDSII